MGAPHVSQTCSVGSGGGVGALAILTTVRHSGYPEQARNVPNRPRLRTTDFPQCSHAWPSPATLSPLPLPLASGPPLPFPGSSLVLLHSGYPEQARNLPKRPHLMTMVRPHFSHTWSVGSSMALTFFILFLACSSQRAKAP